MKKIVFDNSKNEISLDKALTMDIRFLGIIRGNTKYVLVPCRDTYRFVDKTNKKVLFKECSFCCVGEVLRYLQKNDIEPFIFDTPIELLEWLKK